MSRNILVQNALGQFDYLTPTKFRSSFYSVLLIFGPFNFRSLYPKSVLLIFVHPISNSILIIFVYPIIKDCLFISFSQKFNSIFCFKPCFDVNTDVGYFKGRNCVRKKFVLTFFCGFGPNPQK